MSSMGGGRVGTLLLLLSPPCIHGSTHSLRLMKTIGRYVQSFTHIKRVLFPFISPYLSVVRGIRGWSHARTSRHWGAQHGGRPGGVEEASKYHVLHHRQLAQHLAWSACGE